MKGEQTDTTAVRSNVKHFGNNYATVATNPRFLLVAKRSKRGVVTISLHTIGYVPAGGVSAVFIHKSTAERLPNM